MGQARSRNARAREAEQGTGLGLPICDAIVTSHGGTITVSITPGEGSTVRMELRVAPAEE